MPPGRVDDAAITRLAMAAKAGDKEAATEFIRATQHGVYRFLAYVVNAREAEDLTQETFLRAMGSLRRFAGRSAARTWLMAIARRVAVDHVRSVVRRPRAAVVADWQSSVDSVAVESGFDETVALTQLLDTLPADRREAFVATQVLGLSYAEAAEVCDCPVGTIRSRVARARADLAAAMTADPDGDDRRHLRAIG
ncbi:MAG TPA: sigma-70 family RNA polymerase sigma factor [Micromonosporaceae bacterium]|nr:sigma-70 family RNA polymerase sigma factor [Micromonosporaceae bacterium]